jgi:hypothetical protein
MVGPRTLNEQSIGNKNGTGRKSWRKKKGKPRKRWLDDVQDDMIKISVKRWRTKAMDRGEWRKICGAAKVLREL